MRKKILVELPKQKTEHIVKIPIIPINNNERVNGKDIQHVRCLQALEIIRKCKRIHKWELLEALNFSNSVYEKENQFWRYKHGDKIGYDRKTGEWFWK